VPLNLPQDEVFLTTEEVLEYLQVNLRTVYRLIKAGKIPAVRVGRQWRFRKRDIDRWLDSQRPGAVTPVSPQFTSGPAPRASRRRVLVVDDEASIRELLSKTLSLGDYTVETVADGNSALARMREGGDFDLVFADLKMPGMDGLMLIRQVKRIKPELPVIVITGFSTEGSAIEAINLGVSGYLTKPFRVPQVLAAAARALGSPAATA
jgi:excisionase family DNA binding protein